MKRPKNIAKFIIAILLLLIIIGCLSCDNKPNKKCMLDVQTNMPNTKIYYLPEDLGYTLYVVDTNNNLSRVECTNPGTNNISSIKQLVKAN